MKRKNKVISKLPVESLIKTFRGQKVILDSDLAKIYGVTTKRLNEQVKRNTDRFPADFAFQLTHQEVAANRSQIATGSQKHRDLHYLPFAFTEHGALMAANVLNSPQAIEMSVFVIRAFVKMRDQLADHLTMKKRLAEIEKVLLAHDIALEDVYKKLEPLLRPPPEPPRKQIGFSVKEKRAKYGKPLLRRSAPTRSIKRGPPELQRRRGVKEKKVRYATRGRRKSSKSRVS